MKITWFQSIAVSSGGMPRMATEPPWRIVRSISRKAEELPDISRPTSNPSCMPRSFMAASSDSWDTLMARVAPILRASSRR